MTDFDVIITGAGPTGVTLATVLAQHGKSVCLIERHPSVYSLPRAVHLDSEVYRILHDLGAGEGFAQISRATRGLQLVDRNHRVLARFERNAQGREGLPEANLFDQPALEHLLRENLERFDTVTLRSESELLSVDERDDHVEATLKSLVDGTSSTVSGRYLVGCDGANSLVRTLIGGDQEPLGFEQRWLVVDVRSDGRVDAWDGVHQVCDPQRALTYMRIGGDRYRFEIQLKPHETAEDFTEIHVLRTLIEPWIRHLDDDQIEILRSTEYTFKALIAQCWWRDRLLIAGDAAHLTPPFIGQGMGAGLRDATNLGWKLAAVIDGLVPESLLETYQEERAPHARATITMAVNIGRAMTGGGPMAAVLRRLILMIVRRSSAVSSKVLDATSPALTGRLIDRRLSAPLRGALLPLVRVGSDSTFVDALLGHGLAVIVEAGTTAPTSLRGMPVRSLTVSASSPDPGERELGEWLRSGRATWAVIRPDRVVLAAGDSGDHIDEALDRIAALNLPRGARA